MKKGTKRTKEKTVKKSALSSAIRDLETEIRNLSRGKTDLKKSLKSVSSAIDFDREKEKNLQQKIARLIEKEANLNQKKKNLQTKFDKLCDKMSKISRIKSEMADI